MFDNVRQTQKTIGRKSCTFGKFCEERVYLCQQRSEFQAQMNSSLANRLGTILYTYQMSPVPSPLFMQLPEQSPNLELYSHKIHAYPLSFCCPSPSCLQLTSCIPPQQTQWRRKSMKTDEKSSQTMKNCKCQHSSEEIASQIPGKMEATKNEDN